MPVSTTRGRSPSRSRRVLFVEGAPGFEHSFLKRAWAGDRGMLTAARIREDLSPAGLSWITALRAPAIDALRTAGSLQLSLFDDQDLAEITDPAYPGERLIVCRNRDLAD